MVLYGISIHSNICYNENKVCEGCQSLGEILCKSDIMSTVVSKYQMDHYKTSDQRVLNMLNDAKYYGSNNAKHISLNRRRQHFSHFLWNDSKWPLS